MLAAIFLLCPAIVPLSFFLSHLSHSRSSWYYAVALLASFGLGRFQRSRGTDSGSLNEGSSISYSDRTARSRRDDDDALSSFRELRERKKHVRRQDLDHSFFFFFQCFLI